MSKRIEATDHCVYIFVATIGLLITGGMSFLLYHMADLSGNEYQKTCIIHFNSTYGTCAIKLENNNNYSCPIPSIYCASKKLSLEYEHPCFLFSDEGCPELHMYTKWLHIIGILCYSFVSCVLGGIIIYNSCIIYTYLDEHQECFKIHKADNVSSKTRKDQ